MTDLSNYAFRTIWDDGDFVLSQAASRGGGISIFVVKPAHPQPNPTIISQLEHAFALRDELNFVWSARPFELSLHQGQSALLVENPGGELLARMLGEPWNLTQFLRVGIGLAASLRCFHEQGFVHRNINPSNILIDKETGQAWLMGFWLASRPTDEKQTASPPSIIAGTLPYIAPEQSGHINRSVDLRSDLYAFGITLYTMLTGTLPFVASDPMEWIHCHVAKHPIPADKKVAGVPAILSEIVSKLMSKNAEDRYQTAGGVELDLRRCFDEWNLHGKINSFPLALHDVPNRLAVPAKLYGRDYEISALQAAYSRFITSGLSQLVLISGYSGIGKSTLVNKLHEAVISAHGLFASGKVDQYQRDTPYVSLGHAFRGLVLRILSQSDTQLAHWRTLLQDALGTNGQLIANLIPEIELVIGKQPTVPEISVQDSQNRFQTVFSRFLRVFARAEHPLVLFLDDLQWIDTATLELMEYLVINTKVRYLLFVGACRSNEISPSHPFPQILTTIREAGVAVEEIVLEALPLDKIGELVSETLHCAIERANPLTTLVYQKTGGNPFFAIQFITALAEERLIVFDSKTATWTWDLEGIRVKNHADNVVDLMISKLNRLPNITREVLKQLAYLGNSAETTILGVVLDLTFDEIRSAMSEAVSAGLVSLRDSAYLFLHDRIQEAAYALVPKDERAEAHLHIGRLLAENTMAEQQGETIFTIVNQLNRGAALITSRKERKRVAKLNLKAAIRAKAAAAYSSALSYLAAGDSYLAVDCWEREYELAFAIQLHRAECEFIAADLIAAEERLSALASRAVTLIDKAAVTRLRVALYTTMDRSDRAVQIGLEGLRAIGVDWTVCPTDEAVRQEFEIMGQLIDGRQIEELFDLPLMKDPDWRATMDVFAEVIPPARFTNENLHHALLLSMTNLSLKYGNCDGSCYAYACLNIVVAQRFGNYAAGFQFAKLGVDLVEKHGLDRFKARVSMCFGSLVMPWTNHVAAGRPWIRRSFEIANEMGDLTFAAYSSKNLITNLFVSGVPLREVQREAENGIEFSRKAQFGLVVDSFNWQLALIRSLRGLPQTFSVTRDEGAAELSDKQRAPNNPQRSFSECCYWLHKLQELYFFGDYNAALEAADEAQPLLWTVASFPEAAEFHFYAALAQAAGCDIAPVDQLHGQIEKLLNYYAKILVWAENCPDNFGCHANLVSAEIARLEGRELDAEKSYEKAILLGHEQGFVQNEALAHELAAKFYAARGFRTIAETYLRGARTCYLQWGAEGKVRNLEQIYPHLQEGLTVVGAPTIGTRVEQLDLTTIVKASQAVSGEMVLDKLVQTLMKIAIEHAGAERALLILPQGDTQRIHAEAVSGQQGIDVHFVGRPLTTRDLPESMLNNVSRTRETVILADASTPSLFSSDSYFAQKAVRSVLCLPLVKQAIVVGVLHLENSATSHAFTPDRVEVLKLLASQAAISIENAVLYTEVKESEDRLRLAIDSIPAMVWSNLPDGSYDFANRRWQEYTGLSGEEALGEGWTSSIHPDDLPGLLKTKRAAFADGKRFAQEVRMRSVDGEYRYFLTRALPLRDEMGKIVKWYGTNTDIEDRRRAVENLQIAFEEIKNLKDELYRENIALKDEINRSSMSEEIIGNSPAQERVLSLVARVAPTDSTVLITGETGTGKELIARAIYKASRRSERAFVSVNCAAIPQSLIASELFGHEKGAFTGAHQRHLGRFELADGGTIFLDEVGELPLETQISLLRVLQEREFERVGGSSPVRTHIRIIAATNRNLEAAVADGAFRSDLFYRLNVFPIEIPPLRERREDIPALVKYFIDRFARKTRKKILKIEKTTMDRLRSYDWPGNIRELQNVIERSLIVCETENFVVDKSWLGASSSHPAPQTNAPSGRSATKALERQIIEAALAESEGRVSGPSGAAVKLKMAASTLDYKIRNLRIDKNRFRVVLDLKAIRDFLVIYW